MGTFAWNLNTTLAGGDIAAFGSAVKGSPGRVWIPKTVGASIAEYSVEPYTYRNLILPQAITLAGAIPGDAMALADVTLTTSGGAAPPIFALLGWSRKPAAGLAQAPFGLIEAEAAGNLSGWAVKGSLADFRGGSGLIDTAAAATDAYTASWPVDPSLMARDSFTTEVAIEVWLRIYLSPTIVTPAFTISARPQDGLSYGSARYTDEWGAAGKLVTVPTAAVMRFVRLGTLRMLVDPVHPRIWLLWLAASIGAGSSGEIGVDYLALDPANGRACSPCSKPNDSGYPDFIASTAETSKTVKSDLSALVAKPPAFGHPDHGLGGQLLELPPGEDELLVKLSSLVPDDPTAFATDEQLAHSATVHVACTPRWNLVRSGS